ncbi:MAG: cytochrome c family protein [Myxococcota bacterium]
MLYRTSYAPRSVPALQPHLGILLLFLMSAACGSEPEYLSIEELMDPETCESCHPQHFEEWQGSMHAYAADDPVFLAMNTRGQEETGGELGDFCVQCHAPMAVRTGATTDGLNLDELPQHLKGVTCYFCHNVVAVEGTHNNPLILADDGIMRGGISDPVDNEAHASAYSSLHDRNTLESSDMCGACHDIVTPSGLLIEKTFVEWKESIFARTDIPGAQLSCSQCHMIGDRDGVVADYEGVPLRRPKDHAFPGVDVAIIDWPGKEAQLAGIERDLFGAIRPELCPDPSLGPLRFQYILDNVNGGHMLPSGAALDRRMWVELIAYNAQDEVIFQSGVVAEGQPVVDLVEQGDDQLWQIRDYGFKENGEVAHMFWDIATTVSDLLPPAVTNDPSDPAFFHAVVRDYSMPDVPARVTARVRLRSMGLDFIDDLIDSGHLDPRFRSEIPTFDLTGTEVEWRLADHGQACVDRSTP